MAGAALSNNMIPHQELDPKLVLKKLEDYSMKHESFNNHQALHSPSNSETSLFSTVDCSSFSSRSDASSLVKEEVSPVICISVSSSVDFIPPSARLGFDDELQDTGLKTGLSPREESGYFEFTFSEGHLEQQQQQQQQHQNSVASAKEVSDPGCKTSPGEDDSYETFPVWTDRTRYCSKDIHSCINPCFDRAGGGGAAELNACTSRKNRFARSLGSVISKHLVLSPGPTFRRASYENFRSRLALESHPSPGSEKLVILAPPTPGRTHESRERSSGYSSSPSPGYVRRYMNSPRISFVREKTRSRASEFSASTSGKVYGASPRRDLESKSLGCLRGISRPALAAEESSSGESKGPVYFATEESVHGGKGRCLPSPRLSFGQAKASSSSPAAASSAQKEESIVSIMSSQVPPKMVQGHLHCVVKNNLPSFTFLVDGLDEVLIAKAVRPGSPDRLEAGDVVYMFYSWKPKGRARANWKQWVRKDRPAPDPLGRMTLNSRILPSETKDGDDSMELEFVLSLGCGALSPRLSFSTWETGLSPHSSCNKTPSPATGYSFPSPFSVVSPSPGRLPPAASSRYVSMSMIPARISSPRALKPDPKVMRRSRKSQSSLSPLRLKSDDERSCFPDDAWSDSDSNEAPESREHSEVAAVILKVPAGRSTRWEAVSQQWSSARYCTPVHTQSSRKSSCYRRFSLPGRFQAAESKENEEENKCKKTPSMKLRELMGVKPEFGKEDYGVTGSESSVTVVLPAGNHGLPRFGVTGPQPLVERWRSGGRCDCGSWDLGCGLNILQDFPQPEEKNLVKFFMEGKMNTSCKNSGVMKVEPGIDGMFQVSFQAPMSYLQAFGCSVAVIYSRGPRVLECNSSSSSSSSGSKPPRAPLKPLSSQRGTLAGYCSPPPACLLDRL